MPQGNRLSIGYQLGFTVTVDHDFLRRGRGRIERWRLQGAGNGHKEEENKNGEITAKILPTHDASFVAPLDKLHGAGLSRLSRLSATVRR